uniref:(S)-ureidoglycine aminohydrolase cupin domain-containing protein n=1 Tax=Leersia perrieri TaxID=77586 RepID=A0A0D9XKE6_9ORYZ
MASSSSSGAGGAIAVERRPPESRLSELRVRSWPKWAGGTGRMPVKYDSRQTCYIVKGRAAVGSPELGVIELVPGDLVVFPKGTRCTWDISVHIDMYYAFDPST